MTQTTKCAVLDRYERMRRGDLDMDDAPFMSQDELREFLADPEQVAEVATRVEAGDIPACMTVIDAVFAIGERERMRPAPRPRGIRYRQAPKRRRM